MIFPLSDMSNNYKYRIVFSYSGNPKKIALPFVAYAPNQAIFYFKETLSKEAKDKFRLIAKTLNQAIQYPVLDQEQFFVGDAWSVLKPTAKIEKP